MEILAEVAKQGIIAAILSAIIIWLVKRLNDKEKEITRLHNFLIEQQKEHGNERREAEREGIKVMNEVTNALKEVITIVKYGKK